MEVARENLSSTHAGIRGSGTIPHPQNKLKLPPFSKLFVTVRFRGLPLFLSYISTAAFSICPFLQYPLISRATRSDRENWPKIQFTRTFQPDLLPRIFHKDDNWYHLDFTGLREDSFARPGP